MTDEPFTIASIRGYERITANQRQALYEKEQELERLRAENARLLSSDRETLIAFLTREQDEYLAALEADARNWRDTQVLRSEIAAELPSLRADAAKWRAFIGDPDGSRDVSDGEKYRAFLAWGSSRTVGQTLKEVLAQARRWRTVERAVEKNEGTLMLFQERSAHPDQRFVIGTMGRFSSGHYETEARESTLAAAVDALAERMDKEAK